MYETAPPGGNHRTVSVLAYDGMTAFETGIVTEIFGLYWPEIGPDWYTLKICAERPGSVRIVGGANLETPHGLDDLVTADTVIVPGVPDVESDPSPEVIEALRKAHRRGARMVSICTGAFALAAAGLLDGRRATTHWRHAETLQRRYPRVQVDPSPLYVDQGDVLTSAGAAAGLDLGLHLVREDFGAQAANAIARRLVIYPHRDGGQAQFIEAPVAEVADDDRIGQTMAWALQHLQQPISVGELAARAHMSTRTYLRRFSRCTGTSPIRWLISQRVQASLSLLESTGLPIEDIATTVGFETATTFRHHFSQVMQTSPSAYRRVFRARAQAAVGAPAPKSA